MSNKMFQSKVATEVWVRAGNGGLTSRHSLGSGARVRLVDRDSRDMLDTQPGNIQPS
ncbi:MAG: hypothetical protein GY696_27060 [Gammaproteobacteria bacterium]|nr:hypothetical protein [Gammaproteobacteria bacterium]